MRAGLPSKTTQPCGRTSNAPLAACLPPSPPALHQQQRRQAVAAPLLACACTPQPEDVAPLLRAQQGIQLSAGGGRCQDVRARLGGAGVDGVGQAVGAAICKEGGGDVLRKGLVGSAGRQYSVLSQDLVHAYAYRRFCRSPPPRHGRWKGRSGARAGTGRQAPPEAPAPRQRPQSPDRLAAALQCDCNRRRSWMYGRTALGAAWRDGQGSKLPPEQRNACRSSPDACRSRTKYRLRNKQSRRQTKTAAAAVGHGLHAARPAG